MIELIALIDALRKTSTEVKEESFRLSMAGTSFNLAIRQSLQAIFVAYEQRGMSLPVLRVGDQSLALEDLRDDSYDGEPWRVVLGKSQLAKHWQARPSEASFLFFSVEGLNDWIGNLDPFLIPQNDNDPDFSKPTTIWVNGLNHGFGGPLLWVLPLTGDADIKQETKLPTQEDVQGQIHLTSTLPLRVNPQAFSLTWGALASAEAVIWRKISAQVLAVSLAHDLRRIDSQYEVTLRGTKRLSLALCDLNDDISPENLHTLVEAVSWVYEERVETRLKLVADRLSIDIEPGQSLLSGMDRFLAVALRQARDSYAFVILERKDAYHKEVRELMKDMKSQADLYAAKVRDLVNTLTRDVLGILVFIGFSFIGKFDQKNLYNLLSSAELALLVKVLASYLVLSYVLQVTSQLRDANLSFEESATWLDVLQHYSSQADKQDRFLKPINKRRRTFFAAIIITGCIYFLLALATWNLPFIVELLLAQ